MAMLNNQRVWSIGVLFSVVQAEQSYRKDRKWTKGPLLLPEKGVRQSSKKSSKVVSAVFSITFSPFNIFQHISTYFNIFQHISTYFNIFQHISTYFNIFQHGIWVVSCQPFCPAFPASVCLRANSGAGMESEWRCHVYSVSSAIILRVFQGFNNLHTRTKIHKDTNPWTGYYTYRYIWRWT